MNKIVGTGEHKGYNYIIRQLNNYKTYYTAYIVIPAGHPWFEKHYDECTCSYLELTYSGFTIEGYLIGWDYAHLGMEETTLDDVIRDVDEVIELAKIGATSPFWKTHA